MEVSEKRGTLYGGPFKGILFYSGFQIGTSETPRWVLGAFAGCRVCTVGWGCRVCSF